MQVSLKSRGVELHFVNFEYIVELSDLSIRPRIPFPTESSLKKNQNFLPTLLKNPTSIRLSTVY